MNLRSAALVAAVLSLFSAVDAYAGCGDTTAGRIDWVESLSFEGTEVKEARLHGAFGWEASPDGWASHPVAGTLPGFVHFACAVGDAACRMTLAGFIAIEGKKAPIYFHGTYDKKVTAYLHAEGEVSIASMGPAWPDGPTLEGGALNAQLWPTVAALPLNQKGNQGEPAPARGCASAGGLLVLLAGPVLARLTRRTAGPALIPPLQLQPSPA